MAVGKIYKWVDRDGAIHFTDHPAAVPAGHRAQLEIKPGYKVIVAYADMADREAVAQLRA